MEKVISELSEIVGSENVLTNSEIIAEASKDYIGFRRYERADGKDYVERASCVVKVKNTEQIAAVLKYLNEHQIDIVPRTGGSSVTMGIEPRTGGVILDGSDMNQIISVNEADMMVTALCGTPLEYLENYLNEKGYTCGHFPQSLPMAQMGGLVATRSIGQFSTLYGGIEDMLVGLEAVLADGTVVRIKNNPRRSVGPDLRHLFIGNEGSLAFVTEVTIKMWKYMPEQRWMRAYAVKDMKTGLELIREVMVSGYKPAVVRLHDPAEVESHFNSAAPKGHAMILFLAEGPQGITDATGAAIEQIAGRYQALDLTEKPVQHWLIHRNDVCDEVDEPKYYDLGVIADTCEISAPWSEIGNIYYAVLERLPQENEKLVFLGGHSSHSYMQGTNIYFQFAFQENDGDQARKDYMDTITVIMEETLKRGGSIAHHHGSGKYRTSWMPQEHGSSYEVMKRMKRALDPNNILNKGVLFVEE